MALKDIDPTTRHASVCSLAKYTRVSAEARPARQSGKFTKSHDAWWAAVHKAHGERDGTRAVIEILLLHRSMPMSRSSPA